MAERSEVLAQLARLLGDVSVRDADDESVRAKATVGLTGLADAIFEEMAASDDVIDRESALLYLDRRLAFLAAVLDEDLSSSLRGAVTMKLAAW